MNTKVLAAIVAVVVVGGVFYVWYEKAQAPVVKAPASQSYAWTFKDAGTNAQSNPQTEVSLNGRVVGTYEGSCSEINGSSWTLLAGEQSGVICWFAGGGTEVGVFDGAVKQGVLDEGSAETAGTRGNFKTLFAL